MKKIKVDGVKCKVTTSTENVKKQWYDLDLDVWGSHVHLFVGSVDEMKASARSKFKDNADVLEVIESWGKRDADAFGGSNSCGDHYIIRLKRYRPGMVADVLTLMHESLHVAQRLLCDIGAEVEPSGSETLAYTHQFIVGRLIEKILKANKLM